MVSQLPLMCPTHVGFFFVSFFICVCITSNSVHRFQLNKTVGHLCADAHKHKHNHTFILVVASSTTSWSIVKLWFARCSSIHIIRSSGSSNQQTACVSHHLLFITLNISNALNVSQSELEFN